MIAAIPMPAPNSFARVSLAAGCRVVAVVRGGAKNCGAGAEGAGFSFFSLAAGTPGIAGSCGLNGSILLSTGMLARGKSQLQIESRAFRKQASNAFLLLTFSQRKMSGTKIQAGLFNRTE